MGGCGLITASNGRHSQLLLLNFERCAFVGLYCATSCAPLKPKRSHSLSIVTISGVPGPSLQTVNILVSVPVAVSLTSMVGGRLSHTQGHRATMRGGLALFCVGTILCALASTFTVFLIGYGLIGLAGALYQPAAQAYVSVQTPYARRVWALGIYETSWACAALRCLAWPP